MASEKGLGRPFYALLTAAAISTLGDGVRATAVPLLAAEFTHNAFLVSIVNFAGWLPWLTVALFSGVLVDRWDRRRTMVYVDGARAVLVLVLAVIAIASPESWKWLLLVAVIAFLLGVGETLFDPASQALLPAVVPQHKLVTANSRFQSLQLTGSEFVGPPLGSLLFAVAATLPFLLDSASFLLAAVLVAAIRLPPGVLERHAAAEAEPEGMMDAVRSGLRWLWNERPIRTMALILGAWMIVDGGVYAVLVLFSLEELGLGTAGFGLLMTSSAVGSIFGSLVAPRVTRLIPGGYALVASLAVLRPRLPGHRHGLEPVDRPRGILPRGPGQRGVERGHRHLPPGVHPPAPVRPRDQFLPGHRLGRHRARLAGGRRGGPGVRPARAAAGRRSRRRRPVVRGLRRTPAHRHAVRRRPLRRPGRGSGRGRLGRPPGGRVT
ncbi:MFS transporter [Streptomyces sp. PmtG]